MGEALDHVRSLADEAEKAGRLPDRLVEALAADGYLRMAAPTRFGGIPHSLPRLLQRLAAVAEADTSTAWVLMVWTQAQIIAARLDENRFAQLFTPDPDVIAAATAVGHGVAQQVRGGLEVSGKWRFASGISHARWVLVHCELAEAEPARTIGVLLDRACLAVDDTWHVLGLRATASNGLCADRVLVAMADSYELDAVPCAAATLHSHLPIRPSFALHIGAIALGSASAAISSANLRPGTSRRPNAASMDDRALDATRLAVEAARRALYVCAGKVWDLIGSGGTIDEAAGTRMSAVGSQAVEASLDTTLAHYRAAGSAAIFDDHPLQRRLRDALTISQHANVSQRVRGDTRCDRPRDPRPGN